MPLLRLVAVCSVQYSTVEGLSLSFSLSMPSLHARHAAVQVNNVHHLSLAFASSNFKM